MTTNEAIYKVLTTPMKKWCEEEYKAVKEAGYTINKEGRSEDGYFVIRNSHTGRYVYITETRYGRTYTIHTNNSKGTWDEQQHSLKKTEDTIKCVDFVAMLRKPANREYIKAMNIREALNSSKALGKYHRLKSAKERIGWREADVKLAKTQLARAQQNLESEIKRRMEAEYSYKELRKELGLA